MVGGAQVSMLAVAGASLILGACSVFIISEKKTNS